MRWWWPLCLLIVFLRCPATGIAGEPASMMAVQLPSGKVLKAEVADTPGKRIKGLMFRKYLAEDRGMLFIYQVDGAHGIWMKNCFIPLDLIWVDRDKRIVYMEERVPPCRAEPCQTYRPPVKSRYVLEVHEGMAEKERLGLGLQLIFITSPFIME